MTPIAILYIYPSHYPLRLQRAGGLDPFTLTVAHTHLTFPHEGGHDLEMRWHQVRLRLRLRVRLRVRANPNPSPNDLALAREGELDRVAAHAWSIQG